MTTEVTSTRASRILTAAAVAVAAAAVTYGVHHLSPADPHHAEGVVALVLGVAILVVGPVAVAMTRVHPAPPVVLVAQDGGPAIRDSRGRRDLEVAAAIHAAELDHGFFVDLGPRFLREYHRTFADSPYAVALIAELGGHPVGMLVGVTRPAGHARWVLQRRGPLLAVAGAIALATRPLTALRFMRTRAGRYLRGWRRRRGEPAGSGTGGPAFATLTHVAVVPGARGAGVGAHLVRAFERCAREAGAAEARLVTRHSGDGAGAFYRGLDWTVVGQTTTPDGVTFDQYRKELLWSDTSGRPHSPSP